MRQLLLFLLLISTMFMVTESCSESTPVPTEPEPLPQPIPEDNEQVGWIPNTVPCDVIIEQHASKICQLTGN